MTDPFLLTDPFSKLENGEDEAHFSSCGGRVAGGWIHGVDEQRTASPKKRAHLQRVKPTDPLLMEPGVGFPGEAMDLAEEISPLHGSLGVVPLVSGILDLGSHDLVLVSNR